jgi:hypothetical protein
MTGVKCLQYPIIKGASKIDMLTGFNLFQITNYANQIASFLLTDHILSIESLMILPVAETAICMMELKYKPQI